MWATTTTTTTLGLSRLQVPGHAVCVKMCRLRKQNKDAAKKRALIQRSLGRGKTQTFFCYLCALHKCNTSLLQISANIIHLLYEFTFT